jgi:hypothetical protein
VTVFPIQHIFLSEKIIKTPTEPQKDRLTDISDILIPNPKDREDYMQNPDRGELILHLRHSITGASLKDKHPNIWYNNNTQCKYEIECFPGSDQYGGRNTLASSAETSRLPFVSQLETGFNTGLMRQFLPRLNSTVKVNATSATEFPQDCGSIPGAFSAEYKGSWSQYPEQEYSVQVCMPSNQTLSPWRNIRTRQDVEETLYINISFPNSAYSRSANESTIFKVVARTTLGYFELPNYWNNNTAGQVLTDDPNNHCDSHCMAQGRYSWNSIINHTK